MCCKLHHYVRLRFDEVHDKFFCRRIFNFQTFRRKFSVGDFVFHEQNRGENSMSLYHQVIHNLSLWTCFKKYTERVYN